MPSRDDAFTPRPGHIRRGNKSARKPKSFVGQVMRAANKAGHSGSKFGRGHNKVGGSRFGRGRKATVGLSLHTRARQVAVKAKVVRHKGGRLRSAPLARHIAYLKREGVTRDDRDAELFNATSDQVDGKAFAERCEEDRHHFRFMVSPEDATQLADLRAFTRTLVADAEKDLGTRLDWVAVDHWNTDNPHIHVLVRGVADDGKDLVISRDYISRGLRFRAAQLVTLELGLRTEQDVQSAFAKEVEAERWTGLDHRLRQMADENGGIADLRSGDPNEDRNLRLHLAGRAAKLERLALADPIGPGRWTLKPGLEHTLRALSIRGDIIKTMHQAMASENHAPDVANFALHAGTPAETVVGRLVRRGLQDELSGTAYAIIDGIDGRTHHLCFSNLELTGDALPGAIVESRMFDDAKGRARLTLAVRSDLTLEQQLHSRGAAWIDRQLLADSTTISNSGFGAEVRSAMSQRSEHLLAEGLAIRQGQRVTFARDLLAVLRRRELDMTADTLTTNYGLAHRSPLEGEPIAGVYRQRITLASGRFAMIDDGMGFQLVPWRPVLEQHLGKEVRGIATATGVDWQLGRKRDLSI